MMNSNQLESSENFNKQSLFKNVDKNLPVHPHFPPSINNLPVNFLDDSKINNNNKNFNVNVNNANDNDDDDDDNDNDHEHDNDNLSKTPMKITSEDGIPRFLSTSKMSSRGPVTQEFTLEGSTPSGKPRLFVCSICTRAFARQEHLKRHERSHTKEKPFTCNICSRKFSRRDLLLRHSTKLHAGASDAIPRLRKRSIKHMKKDELDQLNNNKSIPSNKNTNSNTDSNLLSKIHSDTTISSLESTHSNCLMKTSLINSTSIVDKALKILKPNAFREPLNSNLNSNSKSNSNSNSNSNLTSAPASASASTSASVSASIPSSSTKNLSNRSNSRPSISSLTSKKRKISSSNSLILDQSDNNDITTNTSNNNINNNKSNMNYITNNGQLPLYPLNDNPIGSIGDFSDIASSLVTLDNINDNDNENNFVRFNELQSNAYNYYRRASFSAMSGVNYALTNPEPYASETVEFSTPQFNNLEDEQEKWLNSFSENNEINEISKKPSNPFFQTEIQQLNNFINDNKLQNQTQTQIRNQSQNQSQHRLLNTDIQSQQSQSHLQSELQSQLHQGFKNKQILNGYSFYDDDTVGITESLFKTRLVERSKLNLNINSSPTKPNCPLPFKSTSPILHEQLLNTKNTHTNTHTNNNNNNNYDDNNGKERKNDFKNNDVNSYGDYAKASIDNLFNKFSKKNVPINLLDKLNLQDIVKMTKNDDSHIIQNEKSEGFNTDLFDNLFDSNDDRVLEGVTKKVLSWQETLFNQPISDLEKLNEMHVANAYGIPQGYSFYGGDEHNSMNRSNSNGLLGSYNNGSLSSNATISPVLLEPSNSEDMDAMDVDDDLNQKIDNVESQYKHNENDTMSVSPYKNYLQSHHHHYHHHHHHHYHHKNLTFEEEFNTASLSSYSQAFLFTNNIRKLIDKALVDYPFFGIPTPELLTNDSLNLYLDQFACKFLTHHPFIHRSILNEYCLIKESIENALKDSLSAEESESYTGPEVKFIRDENFIENFKVSIVCLPLLITTIGAVVSNKKEDAAVLYEISRRCIHVYLESRKKLKTCGGLNENDHPNMTTSSPLWLIQSLTLSIIYGLFADEEISLSVIIKQVHALNALIKSSGMNNLQCPDNVNNDFKSFIKFESIVRTIHMIFHVSTLLSTLYNIVPSLTISDLNIYLPSASLLWECTNADEYYKLIENFDFHAKNYKEILRKIIRLDLNKFDPSTGFVNNKNILLEYHVSEYGLICLQNGLHQLVYFKQLSNDFNNNEKNDNDDLNVNNIGKYVLKDVGNGMDITIDKIRKIGQIWNLLVKACILYNESSEVYNDGKILNHYLNLKLSSIISLSKIKESVWLRSFSEINEQYISCFNYGDDELKDQKFQDELIHLVENSIDILKLVFFNEDNSLIGTISPSFILNNKTMNKLDDIYSTPTPENDNNYNNLNRINLNVLHKLSIDSQILFDVILIIVKFLTNYENLFKMRMKFNNLTNYTFLQHFELNSTIFFDSEKNEETNCEEALKKFDKVLFKYYLKFFKIFLNLEQFLQHNYNYEDFETGQALETLNNLYMNIRGFNDGNEIDKLLRDQHKKYREEERTLNDIVSDELVVLHDRDLIMNELVGFKLPFKFLKMGGFLFGFIYDRNFKFINFKHLSDVLFHLRIFLESKDEYI